MRIGILVQIALLFVLAASAFIAGTAQAAAAGDISDPPADVFTPVVVTPIGVQHVAVPGTDGLMHAVYELELTNTKPATATVQQVDVLDANMPDRVLASWSGAALLGRLRTLQPAPADAATIPFNGSLLLYVELAFEPGDVPHAIAHRFHLLAAPNPGPHAAAAPAEYVAGKIGVARAPLPVIAPPLRGDGWVAFNGCCNSGIVHRGSLLGVNGALHDSQRFAIDWMRLNKQGELVHGNPSDVHSFVDYGSRVHAVANGTVVEVLDDLDDQKPGTLPDPASITIRTVDGNHVILDIGHGLYAFYAHLQKRSITVHPGERIKAGTVIGLLGNSGNTSAPHLHFHIMDTPSALGSEGLPYVIDRFELAGQVDIGRFERASDLTGHWGKMLDRPIPQHDRFPLDLTVVKFAGH